MTALYGLDNGPPQTLAAVGQGYGLTAERIRQIRNDALVQLRLPALSGPLRQWRQADDRRAYQRTQQMSGAWLRRRRGR